MFNKSVLYKRKKKVLLVKEQCENKKTSRKNNIIVKKKKSKIEEIFNFLSTLFGNNDFISRESPIDFMKLSVKHHSQRMFSSIQHTNKINYR